MSNQNAEVISNPADRIKVIAAVLLLLAGIAGFYLLSGQATIFRVAAFLSGLVAGSALAWFTAPGQRLFAFGRDAWAETKRVSWPERKETTQVTLIVFGFVLLMAVFLWLVDKTLEWALYDLVLGWKK